MKKKAIVLASSRGIGKAIADSLEEINYDVVRTSSKTLNTSDLPSVNGFIEDQVACDVLILNTGGPPAKPFNEITEEDWSKYHNQLFLSFCTILQKLKINDEGFVFLISSSIIKEPIPNLILSNSYRLAFTSVFKSLSKTYAERGITCINIAPGPIKTDLLLNLVKDIQKFENSLPLKRAGKPE